MTQRIFNIKQRSIKMNTTIKNYIVNKTYTVEEFEALNYAVNDQEIAVKWDIVDAKHQGKKVSEVAAEEKKTVVIIRNKVELEREILQDDIERFLNSFESNNLERFKNRKYNSDFIIGDNPISVAGHFVLNYLSTVDSGLGSETSSYPFAINQDIVLTIKHFIQDEQTLFTLYDVMIPYVETVNQHIQNGVDFIEAINLVNPSLQAFIESEALDASIMKKLSDLI